MGYVTAWPFSDHTCGMEASDGCSSCAGLGLEARLESALGNSNGLLPVLAAAASAAGPSDGCACIMEARWGGSPLGAGAGLGVGAADGLLGSETLAAVLDIAAWDAAGWSSCAGELWVC